jgi:hypothetical protein
MLPWMHAVWTVMEEVERLDFWKELLTPRQ